MSTNRLVTRMPPVRPLDMLVTLRILVVADPAESRGVRLKSGRSIAIFRIAAAARRRMAKLVIQGDYGIVKAGRFSAIRLG